MTTVNDFFRPYGVVPLSPLEVSNAVKEWYYISEFPHEQMRRVVEMLMKAQRGGE